MIDPLTEYIELPEGRLDEIMAIADKDKDGVLNFSEFKHAFLKTMS